MPGFYAEKKNANQHSLFRFILIWTKTEVLQDETGISNSQQTKITKTFLASSS